MANTSNTSPHFLGVPVFNYISPNFYKNFLTCPSCKEFYDLNKTLPYISGKCKFFNYFIS